jgi:hypothetical protein
VRTQTRDGGEKHVFESEYVKNGLNEAHFRQGHQNDFETEASELWKKKNLWIMFELCKTEFQYSKKQTFKSF